MNNLKTDINGGFPWVLDDWRWKWDQIDAFFTALIGALGVSETAFIIQGCEVTINGNDIDVAVGYIYADEQIIRVDAQTITGGVPADFIHVVINTTYDAAGNKALEDGGTADAYEKKRAVFTVGSGTPTSEIVFDIENAETLQYIIATSNDNFDDSFLTNASFTNYSLHIEAMTGSTMFYKKVGRMALIVLALTFDLDATIVATDEISFNLPGAVPLPVLNGVNLGNSIAKSGSTVYPVSLELGNDRNLVVKTLNGENYDANNPVTLNGYFWYMCTP